MLLERWNTHHHKTNLQTIYHLICCTVDNDVESCAKPGEDTCAAPFASVFRNASKTSAFLPSCRMHAIQQRQQQPNTRQRASSSSKGNEARLSTAAKTSEQLNNKQS